MNEPLRLAQFLRERCAQNQYGLSYLDHERTLIQIPWPVVPKQTGRILPGFQIYHEWAVLSFLRRGNRDASERQETPTQEKHRFRNALARANGIVYRRDIKVDGARVYQFIANQSTMDSLSPSPSPQQSEAVETNLEEPHQILSPCHLNSQWSNKIFNFDSHSSPQGHNEESADFFPRFDQIDVEDLIKLPEDTQPLDRNPNPPLDPFSPVPPNQTSPFSTSADSFYIEEQPELEIEVGFRKDDAVRYTVANKHGCRVFFGTNIPNLSQLLEKDHLNDIMKKFRYEQELYYGPETFQQIPLPSPCEFMKSPAQKKKTESILGNMERGLLLHLYYPDVTTEVPDIYAKRLCQTRVFLCPDNCKGLSENFQSIQSFQRMEWIKVFDGNRFCEQLYKAEQAPNKDLPYPCPSFTLSLGQRPSCEKRSLLFVSLTVTVQSAHRLLQIKLDKDEEIYISHVTSIDLEAQNLARNLSESLRIQAASLKI